MQQATTLKSLRLIVYCAFYFLPWAFAEYAHPTAALKSFNVTVVSAVKVLLSVLAVLLAMSLQPSLT